MAGFYGYSNGRLGWRSNAVIKISGYEVTGNYFDLLGVQPEAGRFFHAPDEHGPDSAPYVVLTDALWRGTSHADRGFIGTARGVDKHPCHLVRVAPPPVSGPDKFRWSVSW